VLAVVFLNGEYAAVGGARTGGGVGPDGEADPAGPVAAAAYFRALAERADLVIGADGGSAHALAIGVMPDLVVGDFDSLAADLLDRASAAGAEIVRHPVRKDFTDAELAAGEALARRCDEIVLVGALGGAADHLLGNIAVLRRLAEQGVAARIASPDLCARVLCAATSVTLAASTGTRTSLLALTDTAEVTLSGFEFELTRGTLSAATCLGLSNAIAAAPACITVHAGAVLAFVHSGEEAFAASVAESG
jgi:thiamine pyrophosphokinase